MSGAYLDVIGTAPSFNSNPERNYVDALNLTCPITPRVLQQFVGVRPHFARARPPLPGAPPRLAYTPVLVRPFPSLQPELMFWDDAADISSSDLVLMLMSSLLPVAENGWSTQSVILQGLNPSRYSDMRCRLAKRGMQSHDAYGHVGTFCLTEYDAIAMPWSGL